MISREGFKSQMNSPRDQHGMAAPLLDDSCLTCGAPAASLGMHECWGYAEALRQSLGQLSPLLELYDTAITGLLSGIQLGGTALQAAVDYASNLPEPVIHINQEPERRHQ